MGLGGAAARDRLPPPAAARRDGDGADLGRAAVGPRFIRYVRIDGPDGAVCAQAASEWCLIDIRTRRPTRVPDALVEAFS